MKTKIISIITILFIIASCDKKVYFDIPDYEKPLINNNDTVAFVRNDMNVIDSFSISVTIDYDISDKRYYHEVITLRYNQINKTSKFNQILINHSESTGLSVDGNYYPAIYSKDLSDTSLTIKGFNYNSVFIRERISTSNLIPVKLYYSHKYGIIRYDFLDKSYFELIK